MVIRTLAALPLLALAACDRGTPPASPEVPTPPATAAPTDAPVESAPSGPAWFERAEGNGGIDFVHASGHEPGRHLMPESTVGGVALADLDGDGDLDAYLVQSGSIAEPGADPPRNRLYRNDGTGRFSDATSGSGADDAGYGHGVAAGDYDGDGDLDLYVTNVGPNALLRNDGTGRFENVAAAAGVDHPGWSTSAIFFDADGDGDLDLYVCSYVNWSAATELVCYNALGTPDYCLPTNYDAPAQDVFFRNRGDGTFEDATDAAGIGGALGTGLAAVAVDFDDDGDLDVFVSNDAMRDLLWVNQGDGTFVEDALLAGCAVDAAGKATASMGIAVGDPDRDGDPDLLVVNIDGESDNLWRNDRGRFTDVTAAAGLGFASRPFTRFGTGWADFDHDGLLDLFIANGRVMREEEIFGDDPYAEPNLLFRGVAPMRWEEVRPRGGTAESLDRSSRGAALGDVDGDGDVDVLIVNRDGPADLLLNVAAKRGSAVQVRAVDERGIDVESARVTVEVAGRRFVAEVRRGASYCASNDPTVHVGIGAATRTDAVRVRWPDGREEAFGPVEAGARAILVRGTGRPGA